MELDSDIGRAFDATALILVFVTVWFGLSLPVILSALERKSPAAGDHALEKFKSDLSRTLLLHCAPIFVVCATASYLYLPTSVRIIQSSEFDPWGFDFQRTAFLFIQVLLLSFLAFSGYLGVRLANKWRRVGLA